MWITLDTLTLSGSWKYCPESEFGLYRLTPLTESVSSTGNIITGRYEIGQFDADGTGYLIRAYRRESFGAIFLLPKPSFFQSQRLGLRVPTGFYPFDIKVEVNDMPYSSLGNLVAAVGATNFTVQASTTNVVMQAADPDTKMLSFANTSNKSLFLRFGDIATTAAFDVEVKTNTIYEMPVEYAGVVNGIWATGATGACKVVKYT